MEKNHQPQNQMDWLDPDGTLTQDQWLACHLMFYTFILIGKTGPFKDPERKDIEDYTKKAFALLKKTVSEAQETQLSKSLKEANESLYDIYINVNAEQSEESTYFRRVHIGFLKKIVRYVKEHLGEIDFNDYFTDIFYDDEGIYSPMATDIINDYVSKIEGDKDDEEDERFDEPEMKQTREMAYNLYKEFWKDKRPVMFSLSVEKGLVFHIMALTLCNRTLPRELYIDYQKKVVIAVSIYKAGLEQSQKKSTLTSANEEFAKLMTKVLSRIRQGVNDQDKYDPKNEFFALATDTAIEFLKTVKRHLEDDLLNDAYVKYDDIIAGDKVKDAVVRLYNHAIEEFTQIYGDPSVDEEDDEDEDWEDEEETDPVDDLLEIYRRSWDSVRDILHSASMERLLVSHAINLIICHKCLDKKQFAKYQKAVEKAIYSYLGQANQKQKEFALKGANYALLRLKEKSFEWVEREYENDEEDMSMYNDILTLAIDNSLVYVTNIVDEETAIAALKDIPNGDRGTETIRPIDSYALDVYTKALQECEKIYRELGAEPDDDMEDEDDWDEEDDLDELEDEDFDYDEEDWDEDDEEDWAEDDEEDWDEDDEEDWDDDDNQLPEETELETHMSYIFGVLCGLDDSEGILFHTVSLEIMRRNLPEAVFDKYRKTVNRFISSVQKGFKRNAIEEQHLEVDKEYANVILNIGDITDNWPTYDGDGDLGDFMLISIATEYCLDELGGQHKIDIKKVLRELSFNKKTQQYWCPIAGKLASKYIDMAGKALDNMVGE